MKKYLLILSLLGIFVLKGFGQSADRISSIIKTNSVTKGEASYLAASYLGLIEEEGKNEEAFSALAEQGYFNAKDSGDDLIDYATLSYIYAKALDIKGGVFYSIFRNKRYAFNELKAQNVIPRECDPSDKVKGRDCIAVFISCMELKEGKK